MARNTIVSAMMGAVLLLLIGLAAAGMISGEVLGYSITGVTSASTIAIGVFSEDTKKKNDEIAELRQMIEELKNKQ
jgi:hypothetical protein